MKYILLIALLFFPSLLYAQEEELTYKGVVREVSEVPCSEYLDDGYMCFEYIVYISDLNQEVNTLPSLSEKETSQYNIGDKVYISYVSDGFDYESWSISGFVRDGALLFMVIVFAAVAIIVGRRQGLGSLVSLSITVALLYLWAIPRILDGSDVLLIGITTVCVSLVLIMYISHGFNLKSTISVISTLIGVLIVAVIAKIFITVVNVDGSGSEEAFLLSSQAGGSLDLAAIFFVSILIGAMGVLDDVVMSQVSSIKEIYMANPKITPNSLFKQAMNIGRDHLSSMVNTLFIAYAGSSFALVILLAYNEGGVSNILRADSIVEEIVRTISASTGILFIVPITTFVASRIVVMWYSRNVYNKTF
jgi:uncharacterized membrane protein